MTWALKFNPEGNAGNDVVTLSTALVPGIGVGTSNWAIEFRMKLDSLPASGNWYILGSGSTSQNAGFVIRAASGSGVLALVSAGTHIPAADSPTGYLLADGEFHTYRIQRVAGTTISFYRDGAVVQLNKSWATASNFTLSLNRFGRGSISGTGGVTPMELEWFDATEFDTTNGQRWESDLANGSGTVWPTVSGNNQGTLVNFTSGAEWVFYSEGTVETVSIDSTYPKYTASITGTNSKPVFNTSVDASYNKHTGSISAGVVTPGLTASINASYGKYTSTVTGTNIKPVRTASINSSYGKYTASVTGTNIKPVRTASVNSTYGKHTATVTGGVVTSNKQASISATYAKYTGTVTGSNSKPVFSTGIVASYNKYSGSVTGSNTKPVLTTSINSTYGKHTATVTINSVYLNRIVTINSTYAKHSASIMASLLSPGRSCTIDASYPQHFAVVIQGQINLTTKAGTGRNLDISFGSRHYQYHAGLRDITVEV
jgi:hypothetical protein